MNLKITSSVLTSTGATISNIIGDINAHTGELLTTGVIKCDISWLKDATAKAKKYDNVFPVIVNEDFTIDKKVASCEITLTEEQVLAANLPLTIYEAVSEKLEELYEWTVIVE